MIIRDAFLDSIEYVVSFQYTPRHSGATNSVQKNAGVLIKDCLTSSKAASLELFYFFKKTLLMNRH